VVQAFGAAAAAGQVSALSLPQRCNRVSGRKSGKPTNLQDHPLTDHDYGNSFSGSEAAVQASPRRNPPISA